MIEEILEYKKIIEDAVELLGYTPLRYSLFEGEVCIERNIKSGLNTQVNISKFTQRGNVHLFLGKVNILSLRLHIRNSCLNYS